MLHDIRQHAEARVITWPQARKISRVLDERWPRYGLELDQAHDAYAYVAGRHAAALKIATVRAGGDGQSAAA